MPWALEFKYIWHLINIIVINIIIIKWHWSAREWCLSSKAEGLPKIMENRYKWKMNVCVMMFNTQLDLWIWIWKSIYCTKNMLYSNNFLLSFLLLILQQVVRLSTIVGLAKDAHVDVNFQLPLWVGSRMHKFRGSNRLLFRDKKEKKYLLYCYSWVYLVKWVSMCVFIPQLRKPRVCVCFQNVTINWNGLYSYLICLYYLGKAV